MSRTAEPDGERRCTPRSVRRCPRPDGTRKGWAVRRDPRLLLETGGAGIGRLIAPEAPAACEVVFGNGLQFCPWSMARGA